MPRPNKITYMGQTMSIRRWAQKLNISTEGLCQRLKKELPLHKIMKPRDAYTPNGGVKW
jgi:hypothetical protein